MGKLLKGVDDHLEEVLLVGLMIYFVFVVVAQVVTRFVLQIPAAWTEETGRYAFIWLTFIGASYATKKGTHIRMDVLETYLKPQAARRMKLVSMLVFLVFLLAMTWVGLRVCGSLVRMPQKSPVLGISMLWVYAALPVGLGLSTLRLVQWLCLEIRATGRKSGA